MSGRTVTLNHFRKLVTAAGTAEPLVANRTIVYQFRIRALSSNTNNIYWGGSNIDNTGDPLSANESVNLSGENPSGAFDRPFDLSQVYIDADTNGEGVIVTYQIGGA